MNKHINKNKAKKTLAEKNFYTKVARVPEKKGMKTYTKIVPVDKAMTLIYGVPRYEVPPQFGHYPDGTPVSMGHKNVFVKRTPLTRTFVRAKIA